MTPLDWRQLIEAFVEGRLGADAFRRRFLEAFEACVAARAPVPAPVQTLYFTVEAYGGDPMGRGHDVTDDADLAHAARQAFETLAGEPELARDPRVRADEIEVARAEADRRQRRAALTLSAFGALGCAAAIAYLLIGVLQLFAAAAQVQAVLGWGPAPATLAGLMLAFIPVVGSMVAFFGAKDVWDWPLWAAAAVFFAIPALTIFGGWRQATMKRRG
jgi:hypothetical protein